MTITRRRLLAAGATAGLGLIAGCSDIARESLAASPATVSPAALEETGYGEHTVDELRIERTVGRFGFDRTIAVRNWNAEYDRALALEALGLGRVQTAVVSVLSTPQIAVLGRTLNPVGEYSTDELVALIQDRYDELEDVQYVDGELVSMLGSETTFARYRGRARLVPAETTIDVTIQVSEAVEHGDDFVVGVAVYPWTGNVGSESAAVRTLLEALEHE
ncbi:DUF6517 family protein [Natronorubrum thiooxidans]|uniref:Uncharacterized protein n=1 Tax=Natronorubrum thiooxidans TaxID=308853 RepID=A0A1N7F1D0_9EURY|nr:DUF6517 family protein [Natronorubrum thiooxidans]SIR94119.1 hypothetical protein SAMN05421752_105249 [Natronorubrum thiooxidans]